MRRPRTKRAGVHFNSTVLLKFQLQEEITKLERQLQALQLSDNAADFSKLLSYREMISSRRNMLRRLPR